MMVHASNSRAGICIYIFADSTRNDSGGYPRLLTLSIPTESVRSSSGIWSIEDQYTRLCSSAEGEFQVRQSWRLSLRPMINEAAW